MFKKVTRKAKGLASEKFQFDVVVDTLTAVADVGYPLRVTWVRGQKVASSRWVYAQREPRGDSEACRADFGNETLTIISTVYAASDFTVQPKECKLKIQQERSQHSIETIGKIKFDVRDFIQAATSTHGFSKRMVYSDKLYEFNSKYAPLKSICVRIGVKWIAELSPNHGSSVNGVEAPRASTVIAKHILASHSLLSDGDDMSQSGSDLDQTPSSNFEDIIGRNVRDVETIREAYESHTQILRRRLKETQSQLTNVSSQLNVVEVELVYKKVELVNAVDHVNDLEVEVNELRAALDEIRQNSEASSLMGTLSDNTRKMMSRMTFGFLKSGDDFTHNSPVAEAGRLESAADFRRGTVFENDDVYHGTSATLAHESQEPDNGPRCGQTWADYYREKERREEVEEISRQREEAQKPVRKRTGFPGIFRF